MVVARLDQKTDFLSSCWTLKMSPRKMRWYGEKGARVQLVSSDGYCIRQQACNAMQEKFARGCGLLEGNDGCCCQALPVEPVGHLRPSTEHTIHADLFRQTSRRSLDKASLNCNIRCCFSKNDFVSVDGSWY